MRQQNQHGDVGLMSEQPARETLQEQGEGVALHLAPEPVSGSGTASAPSDYPLLLLLLGAELENDSRQLLSGQVLNSCDIPNSLPHLG